LARAAGAFPKAPLPRPTEQPSSPRRTPCHRFPPDCGCRYHCRRHLQADAQSVAGDFGAANGHLVPDLCQESASSMCPELRAIQRAAFPWLWVFRWSLVGAILGHLPGWAEATKMTRDSGGLLNQSAMIAGPRETRRCGPGASPSNRSGTDPRSEPSQCQRIRHFSWHVQPVPMQWGIDLAGRG
jgi:hypothetical protein